MPQQPIDDATGTTTIHIGPNIVSGDTTTWKEAPLTGLRWNGIHREGDVVVMNNEQVTYSLSLPLSWFTEDYDDAYERGQHVFVSTDPESQESISVQWFIVDSDQAFTLTEKLDRIKEQTELDGLAFTDGYVNEAKRYIVVNGRLPNLPDMLFTDIYFYTICDGWSQWTNSTVVSMVYDQAHTMKWQQDIDFIQQAGVQHVCG